MHFLEKVTGEKEAFNYRQKVELGRLLRKQEEETLFLQGARYRYLIAAQETGDTLPTGGQVPYNSCSGSWRWRHFSYRGPGTLVIS